MGMRDPERGAFGTTHAVRAVALLVLALAGCAPGAEGGGGSAAPPEPGTAVTTLPPLPPVPQPPPTGRVYADLRQSSRDVAAGQMQVWLRNDTVRPVAPERITYRDARLVRTVTGERLREIPARSERGYPLALPEPACGSPDRARLVVDLPGRTLRLPVEDETDVVGRYQEARCAELTATDVAMLRFRPRVDVEGEDVESVAHVVLEVAPRGDPARRLEIASVTGTPVLTSAGGSGAWQPALAVRGDGPATTVALDMRPARCDPHAFMESGGATAFGVEVVVDGERGRFLLRMDTRLSATMIDFATTACGLG